VSGGLLPLGPSSTPRLTSRSLWPGSVIYVLVAGSPEFWLVECDCVIHPRVVGKVIVKTI